MPTLPDVCMNTVFGRSLHTLSAMSLTYRSLTLIIQASASAIMSSRQLVARLPTRSANVCADSIVRLQIWVGGIPAWLNAKAKWVATLPAPMITILIFIYIVFISLKPHFCQLQTAFSNANRYKSSHCFAKTTAILPIFKKDLLFLPTERKWA